MVPTSGFEFCHAATLVRSRVASEKRPVAIIWILWGCPAGCEAGPIATEIDESVGDGAAIGFDRAQAERESNTQTAKTWSREGMCSPVTDYMFNKRQSI